MKTFQISIERWSADAGQLTALCNGRAIRSCHFKDFSQQLSYQRTLVDQLRELGAKNIKYCLTH